MMPCVMSFVLPLLCVMPCFPGALFDAAAKVQNTLLRLLCSVQCTVQYINLLCPNIVYVENTMIYSYMIMFLCSVHRRGGL
jgi:hypothetical protein